MIPIYFSPLPPGREAVPLAQACGIGRLEDVIFQRRFEDLYREAPALWRPAPIDEARLVVHSHGYHGAPGADALAEQARHAGLPCLFFDTSDDHTPASPPHGLVYRSPIFRSRMTAAERAMPPICEDLLLYRGNQLQTRARGNTPVVGFCGYLLPRWKTALQGLRGQRDKAVGHRVRRAALGALSRSDRVTTNFLVRDSYWGGAVRHGKDPALVARVREEFVGNMFESDYILCARGAGNFSYRFYETLSAGRIPLLIDTDCALPFSDRIDWRKHAVFVPEDRIGEAPRILAEFHDHLSERAFVDLQESNRRLWTESLNPLSFLKIVVDEAVASPRPADR
jgi:hypothetical protein